MKILSSQKKNTLILLYSNNTIFLSSTLAEDIEDLTSLMKINKTSDPNSIPTKIMKLFKKELSKPLRGIINVFQLRHNRT